MSAAIEALPVFASGGAVLVVAAVRQEIHSGALGTGGRARLLLTGMGKERVRKSLRAVLRTSRPQLLISAGFAGGTRPGCRVGDLLMASEVHDLSSGKRWKPGWCPTRLDGRVAVGPFITVESPLSRPEEKEQAGRTFGAVGVDMETSAVAEAASDHGVPWIGLRAVLDPMEVRLPVGSAFDAVRLAAVPSRWKELAYFFESIRKARASLAEGIGLLIARL